MHCHIFWQLSKKSVYSLIGSVFGTISARYTEIFEKAATNGCEKGFHAVFFEDLKKNPDQVLRKLVDYLNSANDNQVEYRSECMQGNIKGNFSRTKSDDPIDYKLVSRLMKKKDVASLNENLVKLNKTMRNVIPGSYLISKI